MLDTTDWVLQCKLLIKEQQKKNTIGFVANALVSSEKPSTFDVVEERGKAQVIYPQISLNYQRRLKNNFSIGARIDLLDFYYRSTRGLLLGNNELFFQNGYNLAIRSTYTMNLSHQMLLRFALDFTLVSFQRASQSFSFSSPQVALENGNFNYQDDALTNPFLLKFYEFSPFWKVAGLRTQIGIDYKSRWHFSYQWQLRKRATIKDYPVVFGMHSLTIGFDILNSVKNKKKRKKA